MNEHNNPQEKSAIRNHSDRAKRSRSREATLPLSAPGNRDACAAGSGTGLGDYHPGAAEPEQGARAEVSASARGIADNSQIHSQIQHCDQKAMVGELAAGFAHEIGTPLTVIQGTAEYLLIDLDDTDPRRQDFETILSQTGRITRLMEQLLAFSRSSGPGMRALDINRLLMRVLDLLDHQICRYNCQVTTDLGENIPPLAGEKNQLTHAFLNIIFNAFQSLPGSGSVSIRTRTRNHEGDWIEVAVADSGCGISKDNLGRIFDPFFTTKAPGSSTGLGLTTSLYIIRNHGGAITVESTVNQGSVVTVSLPIMKDGSSAY